MYNQNNMYSGNSFNNQNLNGVNGEYKQYSSQNPVNNGKKKPSAFGTIVLVLLLIVCVGVLLQATGVVDVTTMFEGKSSQTDRDNEQKDENTNEKNDEEQSYDDTPKDKLKKYCSTYGTQVTETKMYVNGRFVNSTDNFDSSEVFDDNGMLKTGEMCGISNGRTMCFITDENQNYYYYYVCSTDEYIVTSYNEVKSNLMISTACSQLDNNGYYDNEETGLSCSNFTCTVTIDGKNYTNSCK